VSLENQPRCFAECVSKLVYEVNVEESSSGHAKKLTGHAKKDAATSAKEKMALFVQESARECDPATLPSPCSVWMY
jgi:hypothetical protein